MKKTIQQILDEQKSAEIYKSSDRRIANIISANDKKTDPTFLENIRKKNQALAKDPAWLEATTRGARKTAEKLRGRKRSEETRLKQAMAQTGTKRSEETRARMSKSARARGPRSSETRARMSASKSRPVQTPDGLFATRRLAAEHYGITPTGMGVRIRDHSEEYYYVENNTTNS